MNSIIPPFDYSGADWSCNVYYHLHWLEFRENHEACEFAKETTNLLDALQYFRDYEAKGKKLEAILITANGKKTERILGLMTTADIPMALEKVRQ
ncbi:MAG: hypothetical protein ACM3ZC_07795 [Bacteroidota bacterium]